MDNYLFMFCHILLFSSCDFYKIIKIKTGKWIFSPNTSLFGGYAQRVVKQDNWTVLKQNWLQNKLP